MSPRHCHLIFLSLVHHRHHHHDHFHYASLHLCSTAPSKLTFSINPIHRSHAHLFERISRIFMTISGLNCSSVFVLFCSAFHLFCLIFVIDQADFISFWIACKIPALSFPLLCLLKEAADRASFKSVDTRLHALWCSVVAMENFCLTIAYIHCFHLSVCTRRDRCENSAGLSIASAVPS